MSAGGLFGHLYIVEDESAADLLHRDALGLVRVWPARL